MGARARRHIAGFDVSTAATGVKTALERIVAQPQDQEAPVRRGFEPLPSQVMALG